MRQISDESEVRSSHRKMGEEVSSEEGRGEVKLTGESSAQPFLRPASFRNRVTQQNHGIQSSVERHV